MPLPSSIRKAASRVHFDVERLELRRFLTTTSVATIHPDWTSDWTSGGGDGEALSAPGHERDWIGDVIDVKGDQLTITLTLPKHSMIKVIPVIDAMNQDAGENATVTCTFGNSEITLDSSQFGGPDYDDAGWQPHSGTTLEITLNASDFNLGVTAQADAIVYVYNPTITASGGGTMSEAGAGGSGYAVFSVARDLPAGYGFSPNDEAIPDLEVTVSKGGTAGVNDYTNAPGYDMLPDGTVTFSGVQVSKDYAIVAIDDSVAEPATPPATGPIEAETVTWEVHIPDAPTPAEESLTFTATIADDSKYYYDSNWTVQSKPQSFQPQPLGTYSNPGSAGAPSYTETYYLITDWRPITGAAATSPHFGEAASYTTSFSWGTSTSYGWGAGATIDLENWIKIPVTINGNVKADYSSSQGGTTTLSGSAGGEEDKLIHIAGYGAYQYIYVIVDRPEQYVTGVDEFPIYMPHSRTYQQHDLGWTGVTSNVAYKATMSRHWYDEENSGANGLNPNGPIVWSDPTSFEPDNLPA